MSFGSELNRIRNEEDIGVNQIALQSGVSASQISRFENGIKLNPKPDTLRKLAKGLKRPEGELFEIAGLNLESSRDDFAKRMVHLRKNKGWTKTETAQKLGFSNMQRYANYEYGANEPDKDSTSLWATKEDTKDLKKILEANEGSMTFGGVDLTPEQDAQVRVAMATIFWKEKK